MMLRAIGIIDWLGENSKFKIQFDHFASMNRASGEAQPATVLSSLIRLAQDWIGEMAFL